MENLPPVDRRHYEAAMLLSAAGDALGYKGGDWEFNYSGVKIHEELQQLGGLEKITVKRPDWLLSDDTILHLATAEALATGRNGEDLLQEVAFHYKEGAGDMSDRAPGDTTMMNIAKLKPHENDGYRVPYNERGAGCGAAMRSMCIGMRYPDPKDLSSLVSVAVETGRMTHHHPIGFLGSVASALFAAYAVQRRPLESWGQGLLEEACPVAEQVVKDSGFAVEENEKTWTSFTEQWEKYLTLRGLSDGKGPVVWPSPYGVAERDAAYNGFSLNRWGGSCGHDAPMIALDALLGAGSDWVELTNRAAFHGGDNDSTAAIACCCWGLLHGTDGVPECNYSKLEYKSRLISVAEKLFDLSR